MRNFFDMVGFEYKKIFQRKGAVIAIAFSFIVVIVSPFINMIGNVYVDGKVMEGKREQMVKERDFARSLSGRRIDETLLSETKEAFSKIPPVGENEWYVDIPEYQQYARPYYEIYEMAYAVYGSDFRLLQGLTQDHMENFYPLYRENASKNINALNIRDKSKDRLTQINDRVKTPFTFDWIGGYDGFMVVMNTIGIFGAFVMGICLAPMFAGEYGIRTDQLLLSTKFGKNKLITAKLFTAVSFCIGLCLALTITNFLGFGMVYGFDGARAPIQLFSTFTIYPLTMWQGAVVVSLCALFSSLLVGGITLLLSSLFKSPFGVITIISLLIYAPMILNVPRQYTLLYTLFRLLPGRMALATTSSLLDIQPYELPGLTIPPYIFTPVFAGIALCILLPLARRSFKNHQIG